MSASFGFFFSLGYGARILAPLFKKPIAWKILEALIGVVMLLLAFMVLLG
jgi:L-lysine exporter family protein LysE/ArgO